MKCVNEVMLEEYLRAQIRFIIYYCFRMTYELALYFQFLVASKFQAFRYKIKYCHINRQKTLLSQSLSPELCGYFYHF